MPVAMILSQLAARQCGTSEVSTTIEHTQVDCFGGYSIILDHLPSGSVFLHDLFGTINQQLGITNSTVLDGGLSCAYLQMFAARPPDWCINSKPAGYGSKWIKMDKLECDMIPMSGKIPTLVRYVPMFVIGLWS
jgi:hypothetical protein